MIRQANLNDLESIWQLRLETATLLKSRQIDQWQFDQPDKQTFINDINKGYFFLFEQDGKIVGMISIQEEPEVTYQTIYDGQWQIDEPYFTIHRLAISKPYLGKGIAKKLIHFAEEKATSKEVYYIRIDTHIDNENAKRLFESLGYQKRGYIKLNLLKGDPNRLAYDKILK